MKIEQIAIDKLKPNKLNPRINDNAVDAVARSIEAYGFNNPIVTDGDLKIAAGHTRLKAAMKLGLKTVPVIRVPGLVGSKFTGYSIADNKTADIAEWDEDLLSKILWELKQDDDFDMSSLGFNDTELTSILDDFTGEHENEDEIPPVPEVAKSKLGDLYQLGSHRLLCGDATKKEDVERLMDGQKAGLMNTDPPYGVDYGDIANSRDCAANKKAGGDGHVKRDKAILNDDLTGDALQRFLEDTIKVALPHLTERPAFYLWHPMLTQGTFFAAAAAAAADILIHRQIIWVKPSLILGRGDYHWRHELCFYGWIRGRRCPWLSGRDQHTIWDVGREHDTSHPTQKPVELFGRPIRNHLKANEICYEPFAGSGSQFIAAEQLGRKCYGIEIEPRYVDVCVERWEAYTHKTAVLSRR